MSKFIQFGKQIAGQACQIQNQRQGLRALQSFSSSATSFPPPPIDPESQEPYIPPYVPREGEPVEIIRARLLYQSRKRGMLENGLLLSTFAAKNLKGMNEAELKEYDRLINLPSNDWDIFYWATGVKPIPPEFNTPIMKRFIAHVKNEDREERFRQPDL